MSDVANANQKTCLSAAELRKLPLSERNAILEAQASLAERSYRNDREVTDIEAFGEEDLHGDSSSTEAS